MGSYLEIKYLEELQHQYPSVEFDREQPEPHIYVGTEDLLALMKELQENPIWAFDRMANITSVDYKEYIEMVYMLYSRRFDKWVTVKCKLDREKPVVESMTQVWPGTEDYTAYPLRKDFVPLQPKIEGGVLKWLQPKSLS